MKDITRRDFLSTMAACAAASVVPTLSLSAATPSMALANEATPSALSEEEIRDRFASIRRGYGVGDTLSPEDAAFVRQYALVPQNPNSRAITTKPYSTSKTAYGTTINFYGELYYKNELVTYTFGGTATGVKVKGGTPQFMEAKISITAYGVSGSSGDVSLIYSDSVSARTTYSNNVGFDKKKGFSGAVALYYLEATLEARTSDGYEFTINPT